MTDLTPPERWRPVLGFEGLYEISDHGSLRSLPRRNCRGQIRKWNRTRSGHATIDLWKDGKTQQRTAHRLVLEAFVGPRPEGLEGCHNDGDPQNNHLSNLRWDTPSSNRTDAVRHGRRFGRPGRGATGYPNVFARPGKPGRWIGQFRAWGKVHYIGTFDSPILAFKAVQAARVAVGLTADSEPVLPAGSPGEVAMAG